MNPLDRMKMEKSLKKKVKITRDLSNSKLIMVIPYYSRYGNFSSYTKVSVPKGMNVIIKNTGGISLNGEFNNIEADSGGGISGSSLMIMGEVEEIIVPMSDSSSRIKIVLRKMHLTRKVDVRTSGGEILLFIPRNSQATFNTVVNEGSIESDFPDTVANGGGVPITLMLGKGKIEIRQIEKHCDGFDLDVKAACQSISSTKIQKN